jgi:hypothetical protein
VKAPSVQGGARVRLESDRVTEQGTALPTLLHKRLWVALLESQCEEAFVDGWTVSDPLSCDP